MYVCEYVTQLPPGFARAQVLIYIHVCIYRYVYMYVYVHITQSPPGFSRVLVFTMYVRIYV